MFFPSTQIIPNVWIYHAYSSSNFSLIVVTPLIVFKLFLFLNNCIFNFLNLIKFNSCFKNLIFVNSKILIIL